MKCPDCGEEEHEKWWDCPKARMRFILKGEGWTRSRNYEEGRGEE